MSEKASGEARRRILAIDCGSTTTKAILLERPPGDLNPAAGGGFRLRGRGEAPTTVEEPVADVMVGVFNAVRELEESTGLTLLDGETLLRPAGDAGGIDLFVATSSAGGGLQMAVAGVVKTMSAESAARAAMGAGAIVTEVLAINDGRSAEEKIRRLKQLRPDMILLSGGTDGGATPPVVEMAELLAVADPQPRTGGQPRLPMLFAGNASARSAVEERLGKPTALTCVENIRPELERENLGPARAKIQDLFLDHVMSHAPGYGRLLTMTDTPVLPTPAAVGEMVQATARARQLNVVAVDIGGATTDVFSVFGGEYHKSVSANLGMSYSLGNVLVEGGWKAIAEWLPFAHDGDELQNRLRNKMLRPTTIPAKIEELQLEQACARVALRLAFSQHCELATGLKGVRTERGLGDAFAQSSTRPGQVNPRGIDLLIGSGGVLSHAPRRQQAALMLVDAFQPEGVTRLAVDSIFMMPQLGVLGKVQEKIALEVFERDCLIALGTCVAPWGMGNPGTQAIEASWTTGDREERVNCEAGEMRLIPMSRETTVEMTLCPGPGLDLGAGPGKPVTRPISGGEVGVVLDGRGRPLNVEPADVGRRERLGRWLNALDAYPRSGDSAGCPGLKTGLPDGRETPAPAQMPRTSMSPEPTVPAPTASRSRGATASAPVNSRQMTGKAFRGYVPRLRCDSGVLLVRERRLPVEGTLTVETGQVVTPTTVIATASRPGPVHPVPLTSLLGCEPREVGEFLRCAIGGAIGKGETLAETPGLFGFFKGRIESPVTGVLESVSEVTGQAMVREPPQTLELSAWIPGRVLEVRPGRGAVIASAGALVQGILGIGGERTGTLISAVNDPNGILDAGDVLPDHRGAVLIAGSGVTAAALRRASEIGVAGIVTGAIEARDLRSFLGYDLGVVVTGDETAGPTLMLTEGFGCLPMAGPTFAVLQGNCGRMASINGATQIRAGVVRPEVLVAQPDWETLVGALLTARAVGDGGSEADGGFRLGARVRVIREPGFGKIGIISGLPEGMLVIETEAQVRVVEVTIGADGEQITVPRAHVELMQ